MNSRTIKLIALLSILTLSLLLLIFWIIEVTGFSIPDIIPRIELSAYGIFILISYILIFVVQQKRQLRLDVNTSVFALIAASAIIALASQLLYLSIREFIIFKDHGNGKLLTVITVSLISTIVLSIIAAATALEIKKVKGIWKHIPTIALILFFFFLKDYLRNFNW